MGIIHRVVGLAVPVLLGACAFVRPASVPMHSLTFAAPAGGGEAVLVLLPGFGDRDTTFEERGFIRALHEAAPHVDIVATDAHFGYYRARTVLDRLEADVVAPLRRRGYRDIYIAGISMGGHGAVAFARTHPAQVKGVLLFAPYLGPSTVVKEVKAAGDLCRYAPSEPFADDSDGFARANYAWLRDQACRPGDVALYTAVGDKDKLAPVVADLSHHLPSENSLRLQGGHGWEVWTPAARTVAARALLQR
ncbi:MAG: hypothetical protein RL385_5435 [Pseudomonadota bacterium]|jgi:pimeloyl-ACP methyl ester carboxylesterase